MTQFQRGWYLLKRRWECAECFTLRWHWRIQKYTRMLERGPFSIHTVEEEEPTGRVHSSLAVNSTLQPNWKEARVYNNVNKYMPPEFSRTDKDSLISRDHMKWYWLAALSRCSEVDSASQLRQWTPKEDILSAPLAFALKSSRGLKGRCHFSEPASEKWGQRQRPIF